MSELLPAAALRALEKQAISSGAVTGIALMEAAGEAVVAAVQAEWPALGAKTSRRALVLCGPGHNGGDGYVVARLLQARGWQVEVQALGDPSVLPPDAKANFARWSALGPVRPLRDGYFTKDAAAAGFDLLVDAMFGIGLSRAFAGCPALAGFVARCVGSSDAALPHVVAVDLPSGLCSETGRILGAATAPKMRADLTVTFHRMKPGHALAEGPALCGKLVVADIGLREVSPAAIPLTSAPGAVLGKNAGHKFNHGHAVVLAGGVGRGGAARLAARAALRIGAGLVTLGVSAQAMAENAARLDAVMLRRLSTPQDLAIALTDPRVTALCLGPGLGLGQLQAGLVAKALSSRRRCLLDADALTLLARAPQLAADLHAGVVLTPHGGEFARLFPDLAARLEDPAEAARYSKIDATREAAARAGAVILFKGADTVIAAPDGRLAVNLAAYDTAAPWLATAGAGDVLAGFITGLLAGGFEPFDAACHAAWLHVAAARNFGPGLIAEDLPEALPQVFRSLGL